LLDPQLPPLPHDFRDLVDELIANASPSYGSDRFIFLDGSPMTHDPRSNLRFQSHPGFFGVAVLYDFIPWDWPGYLFSVERRIDYVAKLARLQSFDVLLPISGYTAQRASELLDVPKKRLIVTGACVRKSLYELRDRPRTAPHSDLDGGAYFLTLGGDDRRKNTETAIKAVQRLNLVRGRRISLKVIGYYSDAYKADLLRLVGEGDSGKFLQFYPNISDEELVSLHRGAIAAIAPSFIEGFSLPVAEAAVCRCPVIASSCAAHLELIEQREALFEPDDSISLSEKLESVIDNPKLQASIVASQAHLATRFHEDAVGTRFWQGVAESFQKHPNFAVVTSSKPRLAFLSPYPPQTSDAAIYTALTLEAGRQSFKVDLYTDAARPLAHPGSFRDAGRVTVAPVLDQGCRTIVSVIGDRMQDSSVLRVFERFGGPCIVHAIPNVASWRAQAGETTFRKLAGRIVGRCVQDDEIEGWSQQPYAPAELMSPIFERAAPLVVHSVAQQQLLKSFYGVDAGITTTCPTIAVSDADLTIAAKRAIRQSRHISDDQFVVSSFGIPGLETGMDAAVLAIELLRSWRVPAELYFIGNAGEQANEIQRIAEMYGISQYVHFGSSFAGPATYRDFLACSNAAVQVRTDGLVQISAALHNCMGAGVPCVASSELAQFSGVAEYAWSVPDRFSPLLIAEQLAAIWENRSSLDLEERRLTYLETHNFRCYVDRLTALLGIV
jgi:glycosyltransferase involved in cell wall biosynthesis